ncbi:Vancomycin B-type resistance protein VanW [Streptomyces sp. ADI95-16]|uniref:VanW family protein n=1 Tax=Streptomyces sp. ADI95-16 TaxID=1522758 RepID=UPI000F3A8E0F|nr:VanW family protein [Streptomyces sp. ADI95-16]AYV26564.1 Vancomycin B-type resistance protein VanW [Streptomyces sp. ADI95-16]
MRRVHDRKATLRTALPLAAGAAVLGFGGLYVTGLIVTGGAVADGTTVRGVDIGGMSRTEAKTALDHRLGPAAAAPMELKIGDRVEKAAPAAFGLSVDTAATAARATDNGSDPVTVIGRLFAPERDREVEPVIRVDAPAGTAAADRLAAARRQEARSGAITFEDGTAKVTAPVTGVTVHAGQAADAVRAAYLRPASGPVALPVKRTAPAVGPQETARAMKEFAEPAMSGPVTLTLAGKPVTITPTVLGKHLTVKDDGHGRLVPHLDAQGLLDDPAVARQVAEAAPAPRNATLRTDAANRVVVADAGRPGLKVTAKALGDAVMPLLTRSGAARSAELAAPAVQPRLTGAEAERLGIKEQVSSFTVNFPAAPYRTTNIGRAVDLINGSLVMPGDTWSFNKTVGERTKENGFVDGIMINDGQFTKSPGGGVSAVATTMYNALFFAGVKPLEHGAHSFYIERYPEGREATVAWGTLDLRWKNDSGHAIYIRARSTDTSVTISFLGTKKYDEIRATHGPRTNPVPPGKRTGAGPTCEVQTPLEGFDVSVGRVFVKGGQEVKKETFRTHYTPRDEVTCDAEGPAASPAPTPAAPTPAAPTPAAPTASAPSQASASVPAGQARA